MIPTFSKTYLGTDPIQGGGMCCLFYLQKVLIDVPLLHFVCLLSLDPTLTILQPFGWQQLDWQYNNIHNNPFWKATQIRNSSVGVITLRLSYIKITIIWSPGHFEFFNYFSFTILKVKIWVIGSNIFPLEGHLLIVLNSNSMVVCHFVLLK